MTLHKTKQPFWFSPFSVKIDCTRFIIIRDISENTETKFLFLLLEILEKEMRRATVWVGVSVSLVMLKALKGL